jgi:hypothetical protein
MNERYKPLSEVEELAALLTVEEIEGILATVAEEAADSAVIDAMAKARGFEGAHRHDTQADDEGGAT